MPIDPALATHLEEIRQAAQAARVTFTCDTPTDDPLGAIAWWSVWPEPANPALVTDLVAAARKARHTWREITVALGDEDTRAAELRVQNRYTRRLRARGQ